MIDELPAGGRARGDGDRHHGRARRGRAAGEGERPHRRRSSRALRALGVRAAGARGRLRGARRRAPAGRRPWARPATTGWRWSARWRASRASTASGWSGFEAVAVSYPGFARDLAGLGAVPA